MENKPDLVQISYEFFPTKDSLIQREFQEFLHTKIAEYTPKLIQWHDELCSFMKSKIDSWWYSNGSRLIAWQPPIYQPYYFAEALKDFKKLKGISSIMISDAPSELTEYLKEIEPEGQYYFVNSTNTTLRITDLLKSKLSTPYSLFKFLRVALCNIFTNVNLPKGDYDYLIYSHFFGFKRLKQQGDHFFGQMLDPLSKTHKTLWVYNPSIKLNKREKAQTKEGFPEREIIFLEDFWNLKDFFILISKLRKHRRQSVIKISSMPSPKLGDIPCNSFKRNFYHKLILEDSPISEFKVELFLGKLYTFLKIKKIIFPFEDKGLERAIIQKSRTIGIQTLGYAHAVHNEGHLYLFKNATLKACLPPRPDKILTTGPLAAHWINKKSLIPLDNLPVLGTHRFREPIPLEMSYPLKILILLGQGHEATTLANWIEQYPDLFNQCEVTLRPYPFAEKKEQDNAVIRIRKHSPIIENNKPLEDQIKDCHLAIFASTSAGFEAVLMGRIGIYVNLHHIVPLNPFKDKGAAEEQKEAVLKCQTAKDLKELILKIGQMDQSSLNILTRAQQKFMSRIYSPVDLDVLSLSKEN